MVRLFQLGPVRQPEVNAARTLERRCVCPAVSSSSAGGSAIISGPLDIFTSGTLSQPRDPSSVLQTDKGRLLSTSAITDPDSLDI